MSLIEGMKKAVFLLVFSKPDLLPTKLDSIIGDWDCIIESKKLSKVSVFIRTNLTEWNGDSGHSSFRKRNDFDISNSCDQSIWNLRFKLGNS